MKFFFLILIWLISLLVTSVYIHENPEKIESVKEYFNKDKVPWIKSKDGEIQRSPGNSFIVEFLKVLSLSEKTAFVVHDENILNFDKTSLKIYPTLNILLQSP